MKKKKTLIAIITLVLVTVVGATFAYYTSNTSFENVFNTGKYKVKVVEEFVSPDNWVPGETIDKTVTAKNEGDVDAAVRISYIEKWETQEGTDITDQIDSNPAIINFSNTSDWTLNNGYYYYNYILKPDDVSNSFISGVTLDPALNGVTCTGEGNERTCEAQNSIGGAKYKLTITIETAQADKYKEIWNTQVEIEEKVDVVVLPTGKTKDTLEVGDEICIRTECFNFIRYDENDDLVLLSKYNIKVGYVYETSQSGVNLTKVYSSNDEGYGLQFAEQTTVNGDTAILRGIVAFSRDKYFDDGNNNVLPKYGNSYPADIYDNTYVTAPDFSSTCDYSTNCWKTPGYSIAYFVEQYKTTLESYGANIENARLITMDEVTDPSIGCSKEEMSCPTNSFITNSNFWLGTAWRNDRIAVIISLEGDSHLMGLEQIYDTYLGVRPVIVISKNNI